MPGNSSTNSGLWLYPSSSTTPDYSSTSSFSQSKSSLFLLHISMNFPYFSPLDPPPQYSTNFMIQSDVIMRMIFLLFKTIPDLRQNNFCVPCMFLVGLSEIYSWILGAILLVIFGSSWASTNGLNTTLQWFLNSGCCPVTISLGEYLWYIHLPEGSEFTHITMKYTKWMTMCYGR